MDKQNGSQFASTTSGASFTNDSALTRGVDQAGSSLHSTIDKMAAPTKTTVDKVATAAHSTVDKLAGGVSSVAGKLSEHSHLLTDVPLQAVDYSKAYIKDHPLQAVGGALVIGWLLGRLTASRY
ncbi:MAG TPA: DUF883 C-terminal domain-containing protein [Polaromonas sp.]|uniref:DUF883 family protein n=1 Tax=Polaromonas sp. TaxID=1869339 RepID=UPI002D5FCF36|nr:DUF883 C-terminal domain-containing protein [Polaromonas sp.]HYW56589.1 DUF883 C-terminal domain-containing protein [Polaromonas sp.]